MLPGAEGEVEVVEHRRQRRKQYGGENELCAFIVFPMTPRDETKYI